MLFRLVSMETRQKLVFVAKKGNLKTKGFLYFVRFATQSSTRLFFEVQKGMLQFISKTITPLNMHEFRRCQRLSLLHKCGARIAIFWCISFLLSTVTDAVSPYLHNNMSTPLVYRDKISHLPDSCSNSSLSSLLFSDSLNVFNIIIQKQTWNLLRLAKSISILLQLI